MISHGSSLNRPEEERTDGLVRLVPCGKAWVFVCGPAFLEPNRVRLAMEEAKDQRQHREREHVETDPKPELSCHA